MIDGRVAGKPPGAAHRAASPRILPGGPSPRGPGTRGLACGARALRDMLVDVSERRQIDAAIDRLYQLPLDEFTAARNALAKELGKEGAPVKTLAKPPAAAWAINQVFWQRRPAFDALIAAATGRAYRACRRHGGPARGSARCRRGARRGHRGRPQGGARRRSPAPASRRATRPGRRSPPPFVPCPPRLSQPAGCHGPCSLAASRCWPACPARRGSRVAGADGQAADRIVTTSASRGGPKRAGRGNTRRAKKPRRAGSRRRNETRPSRRRATPSARAARTERAAEQEARRAEFEAARSARESERAETQWSSARAAVEAAQAAADEAETLATEAKRKRDADARRVREQAEALAKARVKLETAEAELARLTD